mmetsp:Transcript_71859/g.206332  ORF Transcript_71859/g.206332 Transcript_71859/m.206332 type:complete len:168 (-) Transcript_71859:88-591(-)|eukprot:CAMPEP_0177191152 /NCGR_PEP_ID=MMETSP0367-20130122/21202_1 /TAXON_ID=447022 ORGANISM="Scrippsiella hangoei-like, Strain SHHI-4" /NCGR_SAMPLE_ID=MMETSP0367 /ASSEMBLY_ACC=CAM_ASM_000362 /LENGTH=167 /DNA_ID=CAMNT_0018638843 /DNA_START=85 /DNA_END=588 /DNA_ORIENTATION=-
MELRSRLLGVGVELAPPPVEGEAWRQCLADLCKVYLEGTSSASSSSSSSSSLPKGGLSVEVRTASLRAKVAACRQRNAELRRELGFQVRQEAVLQDMASKDPVLGLRSLQEFALCLRAAQEGCKEAWSTQPDEGAAVAGPGSVQDAFEATDLTRLTALLGDARGRLG